MSHLVIGGTGNVGSLVVRALAARGERARVLSRSEEKLERLPDEVEGAVGDLMDPSTYPRTFDGIDRILLINAVSATEVQEGLAAVNEARRARVRRLVYVSVLNVDRGLHIPHFASKIAIENAIRASGIPYTILRPGNFYQNDVLTKDAVVEDGFYSFPLGDAGVGRVDVRDVADAAVRALTDPVFENATYPLVAENLSGAATARIYGEVLGREIGGPGTDVESWAQQGSAFLPGWLLYDLTLMLRLFHAGGLLATDQQIAETERVLGRSARSFRAFAEELVGSGSTRPEPAAAGG